MKSTRTQLLVVAVAVITAGGVFVLRGPPPSWDIHVAAGAGNVDQMRRALDWGWSADLRDYAHDYRYNMTLLHWAAFQGAEQAVECLIGRGADVNAEDDGGGTALHHAVSVGRKDIAEILVAHGADIQARDENGKTPLKRAMDYGNQDVADLLRQHGAVE